MKNAALAAGLLLTAFFGGMGALSLAWTPFDPIALDPPARLQAPGFSHWFGTDHFGRDVLSMVMAGARLSIAVAFAATVIGAAIGVPIGLFAAAARGTIENALMRASDILFAFPALLLAILLTAVFGPSALNAALAIGIFNIPVFARLTRASAASLWKRDFILAARVAGKGPALISMQHILPNIADLLLVQGTILFAVGVLAEASLSYVGLGAPPPIPSWGRMLAESQTMTAIAPWIAIFPGLAIVFSVLGLNLLGDGLRDALDPRSRRGSQ